MRPFLARWRPTALLALAFLLCGAAWADPPGRVGRLAELQGTVWIYDEQQGEWVAAERNRPLTTGDRLSTDHDSRAELHIGSATVRLAEDTQVSVTELDDDHLRFDLQNGSLAARLRNREVATQFEVTTGDGRFVPQRAGHYRIDRDDSVSSASVWSGELRFDAADSALTVPAGQRAEFWNEGGVTHYTWASPSQDRFGDWALAADREDERQANRYVSPEMTGAEDLDRYGRWESHPEYGTVWVPTTVVSGWAPYRYGHWAWVRPWGWTWVDDAPWGFAPFHYGRWAWWGGRWCWAPGAYAARPVYAPALVGWVGGPSVNVNIHVGSGPVVGWVPLAPREVYRPWYPLPRQHWRYVNPHTPDRFYRPGEPPRSVTYANRGAPGGMTVVPSDVLKRREPVGNVVGRLDPRVTQQLVQQPVARPAPPAPATIATRPAPSMPRPPHAAPTAPRPVPSAAVPPPPGHVATRPTQPDEAAPTAVEGRRGHGMVVPPSRREAPAAVREAPPRSPPPRAVENRPPPPQAQPQGVAAPPPAQRSVPAREAEPRPAPNLPTAGVRVEEGRRMVRPEAPREGREARAEGREARDGRDGGREGGGREGGGREGRPGGPRQMAQ